LNCGKEINVSYKLITDKYEIPMMPGTKIFSAHINSAEDDYSLFMGIVVKNPQDSGVYGLKNCTDTIWQVALEDKESTISKGKVVPVGVGLKIIFEDDKSGVISDDPNETPRLADFELDNLSVEKETAKGSRVTEPVPISFEERKKERTANVWFNHWFSTAYHLINLIREDNSHYYYVIGSGESDSSVVKLACDDWYREPQCDTNEDYVEYCLSFCREHEVEIFVPYKGRMAICKDAGRFEEIGVKILLSTDYELMSILEDKGCTYSYFRDFLPQLIPSHSIVTTKEAFIEAYQELKTDNNRICFKFVQDRGAKSFRVIDDRMSGYESLKIGIGNKISYKQSMDLLSDKPEFDPIMVMPYLSGRSISIDCLNTPSGLICIPRYKIHGRVQEIRFEESIINLCGQFASHSNIKMPFNFQIKFDEDKPYLLEINSRMSGGIQMSCLASNINIPSIAMNQLLNTDISWTYGSKERKRVSHIETPTMIDVNNMDK
jgi:hypothetical protein